MGNTSIIVKVFLRFRPLSDIVSPPFSSKASRIILYNLMDHVGLASTIQQIEKSRSSKPILVSPILDLIGVNPRFLFKTTASSSKPILLKGGMEYGFHITVLSNEISLPKLLEAFIPGARVKLFTGEAVIEDCRFEVRSFDSLRLEGNRIHLRFMTPTLLSFPREWIKIETPLRHSLFPIPCFIIWSLAQHWNSFAPENLKIKRLKRLAAYSNYALVELDYRLKPVTAIYDEKRRPRGFIGWILYEHRKLRAKLSLWIERLLEYANYVGIGRSRSIGFGVTQVKILEARKIRV